MQELSYADVTLGGGGGENNLTEALAKEYPDARVWGSAGILIGIFRPFSNFSGHNRVSGGHGTTKDAYLPPGTVLYTPPVGDSY